MLDALQRTTTVRPRNHRPNSTTVTPRFASLNTALACSSAERVNQKVHRPVEVVRSDQPGWALSAAGWAAATGARVVGLRTQSIRFDVVVDSREAAAEASRAKTATEMRRRGATTVPRANCRRNLVGRSSGRCLTAAGTCCRAEAGVGRDGTGRAEGADRGGVSAATCGGDTRHRTRSIDDHWTAMTTTSTVCRRTSPVRRAGRLVCAEALVTTTIRLRFDDLRHDRIRLPACAGCYAAA